MTNTAVMERLAQPTADSEACIDVDSTMPEGVGTLYALAFDLNKKALDQHHPGGEANSNYAYEQIRSLLSKRGFQWKQGSLYFGDDKQTAVSTMLVVQELARTFDWFSPCVTDMRMLRIDEFNDLRPVIDAAIGVGQQGELAI